jgi:PhnB protein
MPEPFDAPFAALRTPIVPVDPRPAFASVLRRRLEEELMSPDPSPTATGAGTAVALQVYLTVDGAADAIDFYRRAFGAVERMRMVDDSGRVGHADLSFGSITVMLADEHPEMGVLGPRTLGGSPVLLYLQVDDVDAVHERAVAAGATSLRAPEDQFHGNRTATIVDPFGHSWMLAQPVETLTVDELAARAAEGGYTTTAPEDGDEEAPTDR